jgi:hypothetical protein
MNKITCIKLKTQREGKYSNKQASNIVLELYGSEIVYFIKKRELKKGENLV